MQGNRLNILFLFLIPVFTTGQEVLSGLAGNPVVEEHYEKFGHHEQYKSGFKIHNSLQLPFYDDFSEITVYPDTARWIDNEAYINATFPWYPVNYGVATMDVIDARGHVYLEASPFTFLADHLTSRPIRLDSVFDPGIGQMKKLGPADSVYLSFYYQPQGRGDAPLKHDSLVLQFGHYNGDTVFSHFDSTLVFGYNYLEAMAQFGGEWLPPGFVILPFITCDSIPYTLKDTLFIQDSLMIPCDSIFALDTDWNSIWSAEGDTLRDPIDSVFIDKYGVYFRDVVIPITDTNWFRNDFQFRFVNYASISFINSWQSNTDHWHIDGVYLNHGRTVKDMFVREARFMEPPTSFIIDFSTMPYRHYAGNAIKYKPVSVPVYVHNNDSVPHNLVYNHYVLNANGDTLEPFLMDDIMQVLGPRTGLDIYDYQPFVESPVKYFFVSASIDTADYFISHVVHDADEPQIGDTVVYHQKFRDYFSYDDGSAEAGYGLSPAGAQLAVQFRTEVPDTLRGVQIYFNHTFNNNNNRLFHVGVWNDNDGEPGNLLYKEENVRPEFTNGLNRFYNLVFSDYVKLGVQVFYVGWIQTSNHNLNIGYDRNVNSQIKNFYNVNGLWTPSSLEGSIMIRPIVGKALGKEQKEYKSGQEELLIHPNPPGLSPDIFIRLPEDESDPSLRNSLVLSIYDVCGKVVYHGPYTEVLPADAFKQGFYIVSLVNTLRSTKYTAKLLIVK
jgi:hypothetical protein